jgi:hypothetical protein
MTTPIFADERLFTTPPPPASSHSDDGSETDPDRVRRLEDEVLTLRDTMSRFAELVLGELKQIRKADGAPGGAPGAVPVPDLPSPSGTSAKRPWLLTELLRDLMTTLRMYLDPRYRVRRSTQIMVPLVLGLFVVNYLFFSVFPIPIINVILEKVVDILLAVVLYKVLSREVARYREALAQYAAWEAARANHGTTRVIHTIGEGPTVEMDIER